MIWCRNIRSIANWNTCYCCSLQASPSGWVRVEIWIFISHGWVLYVHQYSTLVQTEISHHLVHILMLLLFVRFDYERFQDFCTAVNNITVMNITFICNSLSCPFYLAVEGLREGEMIRSDSREQRKKLLPGGSGSGDLDDVTEALMGLPTILYPDPTTTTAAPAAATTTGIAW